MDAGNIHANFPVHLVIRIFIIIIIIIITYLLTYLLQLSFHPVAVVLTPVQTKQIIYVNETIQKHSTHNTKHSKYKYTYYQNTDT